MNFTAKLKKSKIRYILIVLGVLFGLYALNYLITPYLAGGAGGYAKGCLDLETYYRPHFTDQFDSKVWKGSGLVDDGNHKKDSPTYGQRYAMVDDVLRVHISLGMADEQVRSILGNPDGILDKQSILASPDPYGGDKLNPNKEILESSDNIAYWSYTLAHQWQYPAKSIWFPRMFLSFDRWKLIIKMQNGKVANLEVSF